MNKNTQGNVILIVLVVLFVSFATSMTVLYLNREKVSDYLNKLMKPEKRNVIKIQEPDNDEKTSKQMNPNNNIRPMVYTKEEAVNKANAYIKIFEELDKEFFNLFTLEKLTDPNPENVKKTVKRLREINTKYQEEILFYFESRASACSSTKAIEYELRQVEQIYVLKKPSVYQKEIFLDNFPGKRLNKERDYQQLCKPFYDEIGAKILEF